MQTPECGIIHRFHVWSSLTVLVRIVSLLAIATWSLLGLVMIGPGMKGVYFRCGSVTREVLGSGVHFVLPPPWGRIEQIAVGPIHTLRLGHDMTVLGSGSETVSVAVSVRVIVGSTDTEVRQFATLASDPLSIVQCQCEQIVSTSIRTSELNQLLGSGRSDWQRRLNESVRHAIDHSPYGLRFLSLDVLRIDPPATTRQAFLDVVNGRIEAESMTTAAALAASAELDRCRMMSATSIADAHVAKTEMQSHYHQEHTRFQMLANLWQRFPEGMQSVLSHQELSSVLADREFILLDPALPAGTQLWLGGENLMRESSP